MMMARRSQRRNALILVAFFTFAVVCLALLAEGVVRARSYLRHGHSSPRIEGIYQIEPETGLRLPVPGARMGGVEINSLGFRGDDLETPKPPDRLRLAFLGAASTTFCAEVSNNSVAWPHLVTRLLNEQFGYQRFDYVNAAVPGYTLETSRARLVAEVAPLDPDIVIIYHASNDLAKNSAREAERQGIRVDRGDEDLSFLARSSMLWYLAQKNFRIWRTQRRAFGSAVKLNTSLDMLAEPFAKDLKALVAAASTVADAVVLVTFTTRMRRGQTGQELQEAAITSLYYMPYMTPRQLLAAFKAYNSLIRTMAETSGAFLIDELATIPADALNFVDSVHLTDRGSRNMARRVYRGLLDSGSLARQL